MIVQMFDLLIVLKIETDENIEFVSDILNLSPTDSIKKGERKYKLLDESERNIWMYNKKIRDCKEIGDKLCEFLENIPQLFLRIEELKKIGIVTIRMSVVSEFAQIGVSLSEKDLTMLSCLKIPFEISIFSWGKCVDE